MRPVLRVWFGKVKHHEEWGFGGVVAKRLTKALRGKRRWVGIAFAPSVRSRADAEALVQSLKTSLNQPSLRLMDFVPAERRPELCTPTEKVDSRSLDEGLGIVRTPLSTYPLLRTMLETESEIEALGAQSLTASGKIRLVRERLGLPQPKRR
jgi:hypothetical protein